MGSPLKETFGKVAIFWRQKRVAQKDTRVSCLFISKPVTQHFSFVGKNFSFILISSEYSSLVKTSN